MLKVSKGNAKLNGEKGTVYSISLLSGWSCPFAKECLSKVEIDENGKRKVVDGPDTKFRCFSASQEAQYTGVYESRKHNFDLVRKVYEDNGKGGFGVAAVAQLICASLAGAMTKKDAKQGAYVRPHIAGDFFASWYFDAWMVAARKMPQHRFYFYTKATPFLSRMLARNVPNVAYTASFGGTHDKLIGLRGLRSAKVVFSEQEAKALNLEIDHDDTHAMEQGGDFALLIHGTQPKGSEAAKAKRALKGKGSYSKRNKGNKGKAVA